jgi:putative Mg2+ transporter-C (MgtC) family protein
LIDVDAVTRLLMALALGAAVGFEREVNDQPAGLRTHITVSLGACIFGVVSTLGFEEFFTRRENTNINVDVTRVASNVVVGIGFLGAGVIFRQGASIRNLTTAASLWATAAIGLLAGVGELVTGTLATAALLASLVLLRPLRAWIERHFVTNTRLVRVLLRPGADPGDIVSAVHALEGLDVLRTSIEKEHGAYSLVLDLRAQRGVNLDDCVALISARDDVESLGDQE